MLKSFSRVLLGLLFVAAGINHFVMPKFYLRMMPPYLPGPLALVYLSGVAEIVLGALMLVPGTSRLAAWGVIALLIAIFPANLHMALHPERFPEFSTTSLWLRLPLQALPLAWAYWHTRPLTPYP